MLKQRKHVPKLPAPNKLSNHPTSHKKRNLKLAIQNKEKVGVSDANVLIHLKCMYPDDHMIDSDFLSLTILKARLQRSNNSILLIQTSSQLKIYTMVDIYRSFDLPKAANTNTPSITNQNEWLQLNIVQESEMDQ